MFVAQSLTSLIDEHQVDIVFGGTMTRPQSDHAVGLAFDQFGGCIATASAAKFFICRWRNARSNRWPTPAGSAWARRSIKPGLFACDSRDAAVFRLNPDDGFLKRFATETAERRLRIPNYPALDNWGFLYVLDSYVFKQPGPGTVRFAPNGEGELWCGEPFNFANGLAFAPDESALYVVESSARARSAVFRSSPAKNTRPPWTHGGGNIVARRRSRLALPSHQFRIPGNEAVHSRRFFASGRRRPLKPMHRLQ